MAAFAAGALLLTGTVALLAYGLTRTYLLDQRARSTMRQAEVNARLVAAALRSVADIPQLLGSLQSPAGSSSVVLHDGQWFAASLEFGRDALPAELRQLVVDQRSRARQRYALAGVNRLAVGLPLRDQDAYFEVFPNADLDRTLRILRVSLATAGVASMLVAAGIGVWVSRRLLDPLAQVGATASSIADGHLERRLDVGRDKELTALAASFNRMVATVQERIERDARFASNVSHELRSPLTTLRSAVTTMQTRRGGMDERAARSLDLLARAVDRFERLVEDLLEISRFDAGVAHPSFDEVFLGELVLHAVAALPDTDLPVEVAANAAATVVSADKRRLEQVIANLVANAQVHGGGVDRIRVEKAGGQVRVVVEDRGPGVSPEDRERVFERFFRGQSTGRGADRGGVGLGLALVAAHVGLHGGSAWVEDREGGGARFVVELPVVEE
jgi:two-component system, OmpR family, sensor histidine kinase MtrB